MVLALAFGAGVVAYVRARPSLDRDWLTEQQRLPEITFDGSMVQIEGVRDFDFRSSDDYVAGYQDHTYDLNDLESVWFVLSPFNDDWRGPAHAFLSFGFAGSRYVSISVEARKEVGEEYSILKGGLRQFELMYVIGEERDLIGLRAVAWDDPTYVYPINARPEQVRRLFTGMLQRASALREHPEFYNTFVNNCTTNILDAVNEIADEPIPFGLDILLPGNADRLAFERGLVDTALSLQQARDRFRVNERAQAANRADFSLAIRRF